MTEPLEPSKASARRAARARRDAIPADQRRRAARAVATHVVAWDVWRRAERVLLYVPIRSELDAWPLIQAAWGARKTVGVPRTASGVLEPVVVASDTSLAAGRYGVPEPPPSLPSDPTAVWDLVVVPGLAFDRQGHRLGYGKGYYDAFLATGRHEVSVGLTYAQTFVERVPVGPHDVPVDWVALPDGPTPRGH